MKIVKKNRKRLSDLSDSMTDICFLLIIFFLVAAVFINEEGLALFIPSEDTETQKKLVDKLIQIRLLNEYSFEIDSQVHPFLQLDTIVTSIVAKKKAILGESPTVILEIQDDISYEKAISVLSTIEQTGVTDFTVTSSGIESFLLPIHFSKEGSFIQTTQE